MRLPALKNSLLLRLIKFWVSSKHIVLQRLMNCSMQELLLERKYSIRVKRLNVVIEELKHRITAIAAKVRRDQGQVDSYRENRLFENNQRQFYGELDQKERRCDDDQPLAEESVCRS